MCTNTDGKIGYDCRLLKIFAITNLILLYYNLLILLDSTTLIFWTVPQSAMFLINLFMFVWITIVFCTNSVKTSQVTGVSRTRQRLIVYGINIITNLLTNYIFCTIISIFQNSRDFLSVFANRRVVSDGNDPQINRRRYVRAIRRRIIY